MGWTRQSEQLALERLVTKKLVVLVYSRQSRTDVDAQGNEIGVSLKQQKAVARSRPEFAGCPIDDQYTDRDKSGKETSKRDGYNAMMERLRSAPQGTIGAIFCYDQDRLHRNVVEFYRFMEECEEREVLVFDAGGLVRNEDELAWGIKAVVAAVERKKIARRVRDNLHQLKQGGRLLGHAPAGYQRVKCEHRLAGNRRCGCPEPSKLILDPVAAPIIQEVFRLYATGRYSFHGLARHLNETGIAVPSNTDFKKGQAVWLSAVLKGMLNNPAYLGKIPIRDKSGRVIGVQEQNGLHPPLVDEETFLRCQSVREKHVKRKTKYEHHLNIYPLGDLLVCARCGSSFHGKTSGKLKRTWYICAARRTGKGCDLPQIDAARLEGALREDLANVVAGGVDAAAKRRLELGLAKAPDPRKAFAAVDKALHARKERVLFMFERGDIDQAQYTERLAKINLERQAAAAQVQNAPKADLAWCEARLGNLVAAWDSADPLQRGQMVGEIFERLEVDRQGDMIWLVCVPRAEWMAYFRRISSDVKPGNRLATVVRAREAVGQRRSRGQLHLEGELSAQRALRG